VRFVACKANPESLVSCKIKVSLESDPSKSGERSTVVLEKTLRVIMDTLRFVCPVLNASNDVYTPAKENRKTFGVKLTRGGTLVPGHKFKLTTKPVPGSGGHNHTNSRDSINETQKFRNYGHFKITASGLRRNPAQATTLDTGSVRFEYCASLFGDSMLIRLESVDQKLLRDSLYVREYLQARSKADSLLLLPADSDYDKTGGTCDHHGPRIDGQYGNCLTPDNNHWLTSVMRDSLVGAAKDYRNAKWNSRAEKLKINDVSLPFGGGFDILAGWELDVSTKSRGHCTHRMGIEVDIENMNMLDRLKAIFKVHSLEFIDESTISPTRFPHFKLK